MTADLYDLGQRLYAQHTARPVNRLHHAPIPAPTAPIAVRATGTGTGVAVTAATTTSGNRVARGAAALDLLHDLGVTIAARTPATLLTDDRHTLTALADLARTVTPDAPQWATATHIAWWAERADFPGTAAVVHLPAACATRWITGTTPTEEHDPRTWATWLGVTDETPAGMHAVLDRLTDAPALTLLNFMAEDDAWTWTAAQHEHGDGWDWRRTDTTKRAATGLRARCDASDLYSAALMTDPLYRRRAVHTGHVVTGNVTGHDARRFTVHCDRIDARLRTGNDATFWIGTPATTTGARPSGTIAATGIDNGALTLTVNATPTNHPPIGARVTLTAAATDPHVMRSGRRRLARLYNTRRSWLTTGRTPTIHRRDVPLDVLIAGADADD